MKITLIMPLLLITLTLFGCNKPNPNPELSDEIYSDLQSEAENAKKNVEAEKKKLEGFKKDLEAVKPQTGEIKFAQKRFFESEANVQKLEQIAKFFELRAEDRKRYTKKEYLKAFKAGKPWPSPEEVEAYKKYRELYRANPSWDSRKRVQAYEAMNGGGKAEGGAENEKKGEKKAGAEPAEH